MIRRAALLGLATMFLLPPVPAQPGFEELTFGRVTFTINDRTVEVFAEDFQITGSAAADWRECIDGGACPVQQLEAITRGNEDGTVDGDEVERFESLVLALLPAIPQFDEAKDLLKTIVSIDGRPADRMGFTELQLLDAEGPVASTSPIGVEVRLDGEYLGIQGAGEHQVRILRTESDLTLANWIIIRTGSGWEIDGGSIQPTSLRPYFNDGHIEGTQDDLEGTEPLTFTIREKSNVGLYVGLGAGLLAVAGGIAGFVYWKRHNA